ncbi:MAG: undecaprenyl pyrophosphate phosphatase [Alphaproteobacteria bacterium]|nr:undecaprenyl pyrophosphate phosphatase [Alphaproteobacteria bacterium]
MSTLHLILLGIIQGITEFLPVSSSAHLILLPKIMGEADQGLLIDVGAHAGTLAAVILVFWRETWQLMQGSWDVLRRRDTGNARLTLYLALATIPGVAAGVALISFEETLTRHIELIIISNIIWGVALWWFDKTGAQDKTIAQDLTWKRALFVGSAQMIALIPGTSRSGITMTAGRYLGFSRIEAARLSLLLSIPITAGAVLAVLVKLVHNHPAPEEYRQFAIVAGLSFITALFAVVGLLKWLKRFNFTPFVVYRLGLAAVLIVWLYF